MLYLLCVLLMILWLQGLSNGVGGDGVHLLMIVALCIILVQLFVSRSRS